MDMKRVINEETLKKRKQAAERQRLYRARKRQQQNTAETCVHQLGEPLASLQSNNIQA
jgi:hypothetical protein